MCNLSKAVVLRISPSWVSFLIRFRATVIPRHQSANTISGNAAETKQLDIKPIIAHLSWFNRPSPESPMPLCRSCVQTWQSAAECRRQNVCPQGYLEKLSVGKK
jgi:hypothetical protein